MYSTSLTASFCVCLPSTSTYALLPSLLLLLLLLLLCVFGKVQQHQAKFVCLFDFGYSFGFGFGFRQELPPVHASSAACHVVLALTIIVNLAYGFFIVASSPVAPPPAPFATLLLPLLTTNHIYCQPAQSLCGGPALRCSPSVASTVTVIKSNYSNYYLIIIGTGQVAQLPSCPVAYLPICPVAIPMPQTDPR